jgi:hypothetical protein
MTTLRTGVFRNRGPDILERRRGGGRIVLLGLPFFLAGLFVSQIPFGFIPVEVGGGLLVLAILVPLGPLFAAVGLILMLSRSGTTIDRLSRVVVQWWGLFLPIRRKGYNLDHFSKVRIEFISGDRNSPDTFSISLVNTDSNSTLHVVDLLNYEVAREAAGELASFINKPVEDLAMESRDIETPQ